jgi:hypothetical protein
MILSLKKSPKAENSLSTYLSNYYITNQRALSLNYPSHNALEWRMRWERVRLRRGMGGSLGWCQEIKGTSLSSGCIINQTERPNPEFEEEYSEDHTKSRF